MTLNPDFWEMDEIIGDGEGLMGDGFGNVVKSSQPDPVTEYGDAVSDATFQKYARTLLRRTNLELDGYLRSLRKLASNQARRELLAGYDKTLQPMLREILLSEGLL